MSVAAEEFHRLSPTLFHWSVYDPQVKCELSCTAVLTESGLVIFDPAPMGEAAWEELLEEGDLRAIVLTNANHVRDAEKLRKKHRVPVAAMPGTRKDLENFKTDFILLEGEMIYGFTSIPIPGVTAGESAFFGRGLMVVGDAVIHTGDQLELLPEKYCVDAKQNRASLQKLLSFDFHTLVCAHGSPVTDKARQKLSDLISHPL